MGPTVAVIVIGVLYPVSLAAFVLSFARLRSDMHAGFDRLEARFDQIEARLDRRFERLEAKFGDLDMALARGEQLTRPGVPSGADD